MNPIIESLFDEPENRYFGPDQLNMLTTYVASLPERVDTYRCLRDTELTTIQTVANQLEKDFPTEPQQTLERCLKHALLVMRHISMAMLQNDADNLDQTVMEWLAETNTVYSTQAIDSALYPLLTQQLQATLTASQFSLIKPYLHIAEQAMTQPSKTTVAA